MGFLMIGDLVAGARWKCENLSVVEFSHQLAFQHEENVPFGTPVICKIARRVLNHPHPHLTESAGSPTRRATVTRMLDGRDLLPISDPKRNIVHLHGSTLAIPTRVWVMGHARPGVPQWLMGAILTAR